MNNNSISSVKKQRQERYESISSSQPFSRRQKGKKQHLSLLSSSRSSSFSSSSEKNRAYSIIIIILLSFFSLFLLAYVIYYRVCEYYSKLDPILSKIKNDLLPLHEKVQKIEFYEGKKSYTINKHKIYLCLRNEKKEYYDYNMLLYVAIHELSHVLCDEIGHTPKFHFIFHNLLEKADRLGIYDKKKPLVSKYCGHS